MVRKLDAAAQLFDHACADSAAWHAEKAPPGFEIHSARVDGSTSRMWRLRVRLAGLTAESAQAVLAELFDWERRPSWDRSISWATTLLKFTTPEQKHVYHDVVTYKSMPALGGLISPRLFVELRRWQRHADGSLTCTGVDWTMDDQRDDGDFVRGKLLPGTGISLAPTGRADEWLLTFVAHTELGGWLPTAIANEGMKVGMINFFNGWLGSPGVGSRVKVVVP
jgi:hypothetical protein